MRSGRKRGEVSDLGLGDDGGECILAMHFPLSVLDSGDAAVDSGRVGLRIVVESSGVHAAVDSGNAGPVIDGCERVVANRGAVHATFADAGLIVLIRESIVVVHIAVRAPREDAAPIVHECVRVVIRGSAVHAALEYARVVIQRCFRIVVDRFLVPAVSVRMRRERR